MWKEDTNIIQTSSGQAFMDLPCEQKIRFSGDCDCIGYTIAKNAGPRTEGGCFQEKKTTLVKKTLVAVWSLT